MIEFTDIELSKINTFEPQKMKEYLNDLLTQKIAEVTERIKQSLCKHDSTRYVMPQDTFNCNHCGKVWE